MSHGPLTVALIDPRGGARFTEGIVDEIAGELSGGGHRPTVVTADALALPERLLRARGFADRLSGVTPLAARLRGGGYDVIEAFTPVDAAAGLLARRLGGPPVVFSPAVAPARESLAERRLSLRLASRAYGESNAVLALDSEIQAAIARWLALRADIAGPGDASARIAAYERCVAAQT